MSFRVVGAVGSPEAVRNEYYRALSEGRYRDAAAIYARSQLEDSVVSHLVKGFGGAIKATGEGAGDWCWQVRNGNDSEKTGEAAGRTVFNATVLFLNARALLRAGAAPESAEGRTAPVTRPKPTAQEIADVEAALAETRTTTVRVFHKGELIDGKIGDRRTFSTGTDEASVAALDRRGPVHAFDIPKEKLSEWLDTGAVTEGRDFDEATGTFNYALRFSASLAKEINDYKVSDAKAPASGAGKPE